MQLPDGVTIGPSTQIPRHDETTISGWLIECNLIRDGVSYKSTLEYDMPEGEHILLANFETLGSFMAELTMRLYVERGMIEQCLAQMPN